MRPLTVARASASASTSAAPPTGARSTIPIRTTGRITGMRRINALSEGLTAGIGKNSTPSPSVSRIARQNVVSGRIAGAKRLG
jgi:hypothetical protein